MEKSEYKCVHCGGIFTKGWSDEKSEKEAELAFGKPIKEWKDEPVLVCDDCYKKMLPSEHPEEVERAKQII